MWNRLSGETNIESVLALEEQIRVHETAILQLKRARNSLLNISKLPPEVLGNIFRWNVTLKGDFDGLEERSHNFLLVCHHWSEVASCTPELWSFWGDTPRDWVRLHHRSGTAPLDLVLNVEWDDGSFDVTLLDVLRDRAGRDTIRRIHLKTADSELLNSIIPSLINDSGFLRPSSVVSFILQNESGLPIDVSNFFSRYYFPRLQHLELFDCTIPLWDLMASQIVTLTSLDFDLSPHETAPTTSQVISILASNPTLRRVSLSVYGVPGDGGNLPPRVSLRNLKELKLAGGTQDVFGFLDRLDHPRRMDLLDMTLDPCAVDDVSHLVGPYLRDYLRHRGGSQSGLGLSHGLPYDDSVIFRVGDVGGIDFSAPEPARMDPFMVITIELGQQDFMDVSKNAALDLIAHTPREDIIYLHSYGDPVAMGDVSTQLPNLRGLHFEGIPLYAAFPKSNLNGGGEIFPSLQYALLDPVVVNDGDWSPLTTFLDRRASSGDRLHTLVLVGPYQIDQVMRGCLERSVQEFAHWSSEPTTP